MPETRTARSPVALRIDDLQAFLVEHGFDPTNLQEPLGDLLRRFATRDDSPQRRRESATHVFVRDDETLVPEVGTSPASPSDVAEMPIDRVGLLGQGGMAEVWRARDASLDRMLAVKILHEKFWDNPLMHARFLAEARLTAQLAHPSIPPVHAVGIEQGLPWFAMKEVHGRTLLEVLGETPIPRLLDVFEKVCEGVAYAHANGVVHCDLKPSNIMVGAFGEVLVMDWGVARVRGPDDGTGRPTWHGPGSSGIAGTPGYMSPEQALGDVDRLGAATDVYALGVLLFRILTGKAPFEGAGRALLAHQQSGELPAFEADEELAAIVRRALRPDPRDRYSDATALASELRRWREGVVQRERALAVVAEAEAMLPAAAHDRERAGALRDDAGERLSRLGPAARAEDKAAAWALEDEAASLERRAALRTIDAIQKLHGALAHAPDLTEAHERLARIHQGRQLEAESRRAWDEAAQHEALLRAHDLGPWGEWLSGRSAFTLETDPPARVSVYRYEASGRRLAPIFVRDLGLTPLREVALDIGSYLLQIAAEGQPEVRYPLHLTRTEAWTSRAPIRLPAEDELAPWLCYVPAGWARLGGDPGPSRRVWVDGFAIGRDPVTAGELFAFLAGDGADHARSVLRSGVSVFRPDWPACGVPWEVANSYAANQGFRLPSETEWEKAARGADGRFFPWGDVFDAAFALVRFEDQTPHNPRSVAAFPLDVSPYCVRGLAGNARDWCAEPGVVRGGSWRLPADAARSAARAVVAGGRADVAFRLVRSLDV